jgi:hypothetical protein
VLVRVPVTCSPEIRWQTWCRRCSRPASSTQPPVCSMSSHAGGWLQVCSTTLPPLPPPLHSPYCHRRAPMAAIGHVLPCGVRCPQIRSEPVWRPTMAGLRGGRYSCVEACLWSRQRCGGLGSGFVGGGPSLPGCCSVPTGPVATCKGSVCGRSVVTTVAVAVTIFSLRAGTSPCSLVFIVC